MLFPPYHLLCGSEKILRALVYNEQDRAAGLDVRCVMHIHVYEAMSVCALLVQFTGAYILEIVSIRRRRTKPN